MRKKIAVSALATAAVIGITAPAAVAATGPFDFTPIAGSAYGQASTDWTEPYVLPEGYSQSLVSDETGLDVYPGVDDLHDMNTQNETGPQAGRYLFNTYEVGSNGAIGVTDLKTGKSRVIAQREDWNRLDGIVWTPWGSLLVTEETSGGKVYEVFLDKQDPTSVDHIEERSELGALRHEGIGVAPDGSVFVIDELNGGSIYKFVPTTRGDLSQGRLYALKLTGLTDAAQKWNSATFADKVGAFEWVALDQNLVSVDGDAAANAVDATEFGRPEDVQVIGLSILSGAHMALFPRIMDAVRDRGLDDVLVVAGGTIPKADVSRIKALGVAEVFGPGTRLSTIVEYIRQNAPAPSPLW